MKYSLTENLWQIIYKYQFWLLIERLITDHWLQNSTYSSPVVILILGILFQHSYCRYNKVGDVESYGVSKMESINCLQNITDAVSFILLFTNLSARAGYDTRSIFKRGLTDLNSKYSFSSTSCLTKAEEPSLPYYLPIAGGRIFVFIPFPRVLVLCEMQSVSSRIWTRVAVFISYDDTHYTTDTSTRYFLYTNSLQKAWIYVFYLSQQWLVSFVFFDGVLWNGISIFVVYLMPTQF